MVHVTQVAEFVQDDVVPQVGREEVEVDIEIYVPLCRTGAPVGLVVFKGNPAVEGSVRQTCSPFSGVWCGFFPRIA